MTSQRIDMEKLLKKNMREQHEATERAIADCEAARDAERRAFKAAGGHAYPTPEDAYAGMTLLEHYAGQAMQGLLAAHANRPSTRHPSEIAEDAVRVANELLYALKHNKTGDQDDR
jgi:hypothetical protein